MVLGPYELTKNHRLKTPLGGGGVNLLWTMVYDQDIKIAFERTLLKKKEDRLSLVEFYQKYVHAAGCYPKLMTFRPNLRIRNQYFKKLGPSATLRAIRMCLRPKVINRDNTLGYALGNNFNLGIILQLKIYLKIQLNDQ